MSPRLPFIPLHSDVLERVAEAVSECINAAAAGAISLDHLPVEDQLAPERVIREHIDRMRSHLALAGGSLRRAEALLIHFRRTR